MTQIINLISFIKELIFNRGKNNGKKDGRSGILQTALIAVLAASLYANYLLTGRVYDKTKQVVSLKTEVQELRVQAQRVPQLEHTIVALNHTMGILTGRSQETKNLGRGNIPIPERRPGSTPVDAIGAPQPPNITSRKLYPKEVGSE